MPPSRIREIEQIREGGIDSSTHSQSEQYLIRKKFVSFLPQLPCGQCVCVFFFLSVEIDCGFVKLM